MTLIADQQLANGRLTVGQWLADNIAWELFFTFTQNLKYQCQNFTEYDPTLYELVQMQYSRCGVFLKELPITFIIEEEKQESTNWLTNMNLQSLWLSKGDGLEIPSLGSTT